MISEQNDTPTPTVATDDIDAWVKQEAVKREQQVQEAQRQQAEAAALLRERQAEQARVETRDNVGAFTPEALLDFMKEHLAPAGIKPEASTSQRLIGEVCDEFRDFLIMKNEQYGDSAIDPVRVFSKADPEEQLKVRMDDKLSRLMRGDDRLEPDEDIIKDLLGYWILLQVIRRKAERE